MTEVLTTHRYSNVPTHDGCAIIDDVVWVKFTETDSNESKFDNTSDDVANTKTAAEAQRGLSFSITYDNTATSGVEYTTTNIVIDAGDEWNSGEEISITLTDSDANINSLDTNDLDVSSSDHIIPTITIGGPLTLTNGLDAAIGGTITGAEVKDDIGDKDISQRNRITTTGALAPGAGDQTLVITISGSTSSTADFQVVNYDLSAFEDATLTIDDATDFAELADTYVVDDDNPIPGTFTLTFDTTDTDDPDTIPKDSAIAFDVFSFGLDDEDDNINNAIYRLELEEDGDNSSDFTGTLEYIGLNQINILESDTYGGIQAIDDNIILISDDDSISVEYLDLGFATGGYHDCSRPRPTPRHTRVQSHSTLTATRLQTRLP